MRFALKFAAPRWMKSSPGRQTHKTIPGEWLQVPFTGDGFPY
jgi:hypothetical protein